MASKIYKCTQCNEEFTGGYKAILNHFCKIDTQKFEVSERQIDFMKHAIGFSEHRIKGRKYKKYASYRNYFSSAERCDGFEDLINLTEKGLMRSRQSETYWYFHVTQAGLEYLSNLTGVKITEAD